MRDGARVEGIGLKVLAVGDWTGFSFVVRSFRAF